MNLPPRRVPGTGHFAMHQPLHMPFEKTWLRTGQTSWPKEPLATPLRQELGNWPSGPRRGRRGCDRCGSVSSFSLPYLWPLRSDRWSRSLPCFAMIWRWNFFSWDLTLRSSKVQLVDLILVSAFDSCTFQRQVAPALTLPICITRFQPLTRWCGKPTSALQLQGIWRMLTWETCMKTPTWHA